MTGLQAFELTSDLEPGDIEKATESKTPPFPGLVLPPSRFGVYDPPVLKVETPTISAEPTKTEVLLDSDGDITTVEEVEGANISEDQDMSPYVPPEDNDSSELSSSSTLVSPSSEPTPEPVTSPEDSTPSAYGPLGRGLVDALGGLRDAATYAEELYITSAIVRMRAVDPTLSLEDAIQKVVPGVRTRTGEKGETIMEMEVNLKRFPVEKGFWASVIVSFCFIV